MGPPLEAPTPMVPPLHDSTLKMAESPDRSIADGLSRDQRPHWASSHRTTKATLGVSLTTRRSPKSPGGGSKAHGPLTAAATVQPPTTRMPAAARARRFRRRRRSAATSRRHQTWPSGVGGHDGSGRQSGGGAKPGGGSGHPGAGTHSSSPTREKVGASRRRVRVGSARSLGVGRVVPQGPSDGCTTGPDGRRP